MPEQGISDAEIFRKLEKAYSKDSTRRIGAIYDAEEPHTRWVVTNFKGFVEYFEEAYSFFIEATHSINYLPKNGWPWKRNLQSIYFGAATYPLWKAFTLALDGFYDEASTIARTEYELLIKIVYCSCYPRDEDAFATYAKPEKGKREFNLTNFVKDELRVDWDFLYGIQSAASHGKLYITKIIKDLRETGKHSPIGLRFESDERYLSIPINQLTFLIWAYIKLLFVIFPDIHPDKDRSAKLRERAEKFDDALGAIVKTMPNKVAQVGREFDKVIDVVKEAEAEKDWGEVAKRT